MKIKNVISKFVYTPLLALTGCATIMHGTTQRVGISSNPSNASVYVDNMPVGNTPVVVHMTRGDNHLVRIELEGYVPYEAAFTKTLSGWVFGNIVFGGLIGLAVDAVSGGIYRLTPENIQAEMRRGNIAYTKKSDNSVIMIVLKPDPKWEKIGNLEQISS